MLESRWQAPGLQRGVIPYFTHGTIAFKGNGDPLTQHQRATQVFERGYTDASGQQVYTGSPAQVAAQRGWATAAMRDNFVQMVVERTLYRKMILQQPFDANLCPEAAGAGSQIYFDTDTQAVMGQSLGSMTASAVAVHDQDYQGLIATGAGTFGLGTDFVSEELDVAQADQLLPALEVGCVTPPATGRPAFQFWCSTRYTTAMPPE